MAQYAYSNKDRSYTEERTYPLGQAPRRITVRRDGRRITLYHDLAAELPGRRDDLRGQRVWPMYSESLSCHPSQVAVFNERLVKSGAAARYDQRGRLKIHSSLDSHRAAQALGFFNKDSNRSPRNC